MKTLCSLPKEKTSRLLVFLFTLTSILLLACEAKIVSAGDRDALPPENFRAVVLDEQENPSSDLTLRAAADHSSEDNTGGCNGGMGLMALVGFMCLSIARKR